MVESTVFTSPGFGQVQGDDYSRATDSLRQISVAVGSSGGGGSAQKRVMAPGATEVAVSITLPDVAGTNRDLFDGGATIDNQTPASFDAAWTAPSYAEISVFVDLVNMAAGDTIIVEFLKAVTAATFNVQSTSTFTGDQAEDVKEFTVRCTTTGAIQGRIRQTAGVARVVAARAHAIGARLVA